MDVRTMNSRDYAAARSALLGDVMRADVVQKDHADMQAINARHPDLAEKSRVAAREQHAALVRELADAAQVMSSAHEARKVAAGQPSQLERERADERLAAAVTTHDALLRQVEENHAALIKMETV